MTPPAPKASGRPRLARFVSFVFLILACLVLPQQAAAQTSDVTASIANIGDVSEGAGNAQFTVRLDRAVNTDVILNLTYLATAAPNFGVTPADDLGSDRQTTVTIPANETQATFNVPIVDDDIIEFNETAIVSISANTPADLTIDSRNSRGSVRITDNDTAEFSLAVDRTSAAEGVDFTFTVSLSERVARRMLVGWTATGTGDNPATLGINGSDLEAPQIDRGDVTFDALTTTSQQFTIRILDDGNPEQDETFTVTLSNPRDSFFRDETPPGLTVGSTDSQTVTIENNDGEPDLGPAEVSLRVPSEYTLPANADGEGLFVLNVDKEGNVAGLLEEVTFTYSTANGTATAGTDYTAQTSQTRTITSSQTGLALPFVALADNIVEEDETFTVTFTSDTEGVGFVNGNDTTTVTIVDQDTALVSLEGDASAQEDAGNITFTVELLDGDDSNPGGPFSVAENVTVTWTATNGTATVGDDLQRTSGTATIRAGDTEATFTVPIEDDETVEGDETFTVTLSAPVVSGNIDADRVRLSPTAITATGTITNDDEAEVTLSTDTETAAEDGTFTYTVSLSAAADEAVTVRWTATDGTATVVDDLQAITDTITFPANTSTAQEFTIAVNDDDLDEDNETFTVTLEVDGDNPLPDGVTIGTTNSATGTITDNDDTAAVNATVSIAAASALENVSGGNAEFTVSLTTAVNEAVVLAVAYAVGDTNPVVLATDLGTRPNTVTIDQGQTSATLLVPIIDDSIVESDETFTVTISEGTTSLPDGVTIGTDATATGTITNDDTAVLGFTGSTIVFPTEGTTSTFTVSFLSSGATSAAVPVTLTWTVVPDESDDDPGQPADLNPSSGTVTIQAGQSSADITITAVDDTQDEVFSEALLIQLGLSTTSPLPEDVSLVASSNAAYERDVRVVDNDDPPDITVSIGDISVAENVSGGMAQFTITLSETLLDSIGFTLTFEPGDTNPVVLADDLGDLPTEVAFIGGTLTRTFNVPIINDELVEGDETFTVTIASRGEGGNITFTKNKATGTIVDDDDPPPPAATVSIGNASVAENDGNAEFTVSLTQAVESDVTVAVAYTAGTATLATDLGTRPTTVTINEGDTEATLEVPVSNDNIVEGDEDFTVTISEGSTALPEGVTIGTTATGTGTITDDDLAEITLGPATLEAAENGTFTYTVSLSKAADEAVTVRWTATDGTASVDDDLEEQTNTVTFDANDNTAQEFTISPVDDPDDEVNETFTVTLEVDTAGGNPLPTGVTIGTSNSSTATITDNDDPTGPDLTVDDVTVSSASVVEGASFTINATVNNGGNAASAATTLTWYRSADATITTGDTSIGTDAVGILAASGSSPQNISVSIATAGTYYVGACVPTVSGETDTDNNCSTGVQVTVTAAAVAPQITTQPTNQSVTVGGSATFTVAATGTPTPTYQWRFDGTDIAGATSASYTLSSAALTNAGDYTVMVTNTAGTVTSSTATLTVTAAAVAPQITTQPTNQSVTVGGSATFTVTATGTPTPTYQWRFEGSDISGATSASYTLSNAALTNAGEYSVVVTNTAGTVTSTAATLTVTAATVAPQITTQPTNQSVTVGGSATFTVTATGTPTPTYQWRFEGSNISGATSASYAISSAALTNAGEYTVVVTNTAGTVTSTAATLTVTAATVAPQITTQPTNQSVTVGGSATFTVAATGTPTPTYQWRFDGTDIAGATSASYTLSSAALTDAGDYTVVVTNTAGEVTSSAATLTVTAAAVAPQITTQPTNQSVTVGGSATFTVAATGTPTPTYQWRFEGSDIAGATLATYAISSAALTNAGDYTVVVTNTAGTVTSSAATLTVTAATVAPQITTQPVNQSVTVGGSATFTVTATGTPTPTYQWRFEGSDIDGATSASYAISSAALTNAGDYTVVVTNTADTVTSNAATLTVTAATVAPQITTQPTDQSVTVGGSATFTVAATGTPTPTYQWRFDGTDIAGATSASYAISGAALTNAGDYTVVVTNTAGTVTSSAATLTVTPAAGTVTSTVAPQITTQPTNQSVTVGENATFTVAATGTPTPTYQWRFEGSDIAGATLASYTISSAALTNAGDYTVVVTNTAGTVTSSAATLTVTAAVNATVSIANASVAENVSGGNAEFTVSLTTAVDSDVTLAVAYAAGTATLATDLGTRPDTVTIDANTTEATLLVPITNDNIVEGNEDFTVTISEGTTPLPEGVTIGTDNTATGTITNDDAAEVTLSPSTLEATEGNSFSYTVRLSAPADEAVNITWTASIETGDNADLAADLQTTTNTVTFAANDNADKTFTIATTQNTEDEPNKTFTVTLTPTSALPTGVTIPTATASSAATIADDDDPLPEDDTTVSIGNVSVAENVSDGNARFTVSLNRAVTSNVVLGVTYAAGVTNPATVADDLGNLSTTVTINRGDTEATLTVPIINDPVVEGNETFTVTIAVNTPPEAIAPQERVSIGNGVATGTIIDDDRGLVTLSPPTLTAAENGTFSYTVRLSAAADEAVNITWTATAEAGDTATVANDLQEITGTVTFNADTNTNQTFTIRPADDDTDEPNETFTVTLTPTGTLPTGVTIPTATASSAATITDNDDPVPPPPPEDDTTVSIANVSIAENVPGGNARFTVTLSRAVTSAVVLDIAYTAGTADLEADLGTPLPPTVTIPASSTSATFDVPIIDDTIVEDNETFTVTITLNTAPAGVTIGDGVATGMIDDNDTPPPPPPTGGGGGGRPADPALVSLSPPTATASEDGAFTYTVNISEAADEAVNITWTASDGSATVADDLQESTGTVTFPANRTTAQTFTIRPVDDPDVEENETFTVTLTPTTTLPREVEIDEDNAGSTATIMDNDEVTPPPVVNTSLNIDDVTVAEDVPGGNARFTVILGQAVTSDIVLNVAYAASGANPVTLADDLGTPRPTTVTIPANSASATIDVPIVDDDIVEGDETFTVTVSEGTTPLPAGVTIEDGEAIATIIDNDEAPPVNVTVSIADAAPVAEDAGPAIFMVSLTEAVGSAVVLDIAYTAGSASLADIGDSRPATVTIGTGETSAAIDVPIIADDIAEGEETFTVTITGNSLPAGVTIADGSATGTIQRSLGPSVLIEPRRTGAGTALRRHVDRFDNMTGSMILNRLNSRQTRRLSGSENLGNGAMVVGGGIGETSWGAWIDAAWAGFDGTASGQQADLYGGVDYLDTDGNWVIGALIGFEAADLDIGEANYRSDYTHIGFYGGARLSERLLFDGAASYGTATPDIDIVLGNDSVSYDAQRFTVRGALTGDFGLEISLGGGSSITVEPQIDLLYARERLGDFTDSAGGVAEREELELGRFSAGPRLTWDFEGGQVVGGVRMRGDFLQLGDGIEERVSGAANIGLQLNPRPNFTMGFQLDVDGIGITDDYTSFGGRIEFDIRF